MKALITILRILANVSAFPVLIFFFYFMITAYGSHPGGTRAIVSYSLPFTIFIIPVAINYIARILDNRRKK